MTWVSLQMLSCLGSLLLLTHRASSADLSSHRCVSRIHWNELSLHHNAPPPQPGEQNKRTCAQAAKETRGGVSARSLAPWRYKLDRDMDRVPANISFAECLCRGCIVNRREDLSYNSVPVMVQVTVLRKKQCPVNRHQYLLTIDSIKVPVACTCVVPKSNK